MFKHFLVPTGRFDMFAISVHESLALARRPGAKVMQVLVPVQTPVLCWC
jgi:hypothetical protein